MAAVDRRRNPLALVTRRAHGTAGQPTGKGLLGAAKERATTRLKELKTAASQLDVTPHPSGFLAKSVKPQSSPRRGAPSDRATFLEGARRSLLSAAELSLEPAATAPSRARALSPPRLKAITEQVQALIDGEMSEFSVGEIRRYLTRNDPSFAAAIPNEAAFDRQISPGLKVGQRAVDRRGDEPHFLLAAKLALFLWRAQEGTSRSEALSRFSHRISTRELDPARVVPGFDEELVRKLASIYDVIPWWDGDRKGPTELYPPADTQGLHDPVESEVYGRLSDLDKIPLASPVLWKYSEIFDSTDKLKDVVLAELAHSVPDSIPALEILVGKLGMKGSNIHRSSRDYGGLEAIVADVAHRQYGIDVTLSAPGGELAADALVERVRRLLPSVQRSGQTLAVHGTGARIAFEDIERLVSEAKVPAFLVPHTTSDVFAATGKLPRITLRSSEAKENDEVERFRQSFKSLFFTLSNALDEDLSTRTTAVIGYGRIIGRAWAEAAREIPMTVFVQDVDNDRVRAANEAGFTVAPDAALANRNPLVINATATMLTPEKMAAYPSGTVFMHLGTGEGFPMAALNGQENTPSFKMITRDRLSDDGIRVDAYTVRMPDGSTRQWKVVNAGAVSNFGQKQPAVSTFGAVTQMLVLDSLLKGKWAADNHLSGPLDPGLRIVAFDTVDQSAVATDRRLGEEQIHRTAINDGSVSLDGSHFGGKIQRAVYLDPFHGKTLQRSRTTDLVDRWLAAEEHPDSSLFFMGDADHRWDPPDASVEAASSPPGRAR